MPSANTMKNLIVIITSFFLVLTSCTNSKITSQDQDQQILDDLYLEIQDIVNSESCTNAENWSFTAIGSKACGGPTGYIAYPLSINTTSFIAKVELFTDEQRKFNVKWNVISDCSVPQQPSSVDCINGKPTFIYQ